MAASCIIITSAIVSPTSIKLVTSCVKLDVMSASEIRGSLHYYQNRHAMTLLCGHALIMSTWQYAHINIKCGYARRDVALLIMIFSHAFEAADIHAIGV